jgi:hypothetical protein
MRRTGPPQNVEVARVDPQELDLPERGDEQRSFKETERPGNHQPDEQGNHSLSRTGRGEASIRGRVSSAEPERETRSRRRTIKSKPLSEVKNVFIDELDGGEAARAVRVAFEEEMIAGDRFRVVTAQAEADGVVTGRVVPRRYGWEIRLRLVNRAGETLWISRSKLENAQTARTIAAELIDDLTETARRKR